MVHSDFRMIVVFTVVSFNLVGSSVHLDYSGKRNNRIVSAVDKFVFSPNFAHLPFCSFDFEWWIFFCDWLLFSMSSSPSHCDVNHQIITETFNYDSKTDNPPLETIQNTAYIFVWCAIEWYVWLCGWLLSLMSYCNQHVVVVKTTVFGLLGKRRFWSIRFLWLEDDSNFSLRRVWVIPVFASENGRSRHPFTSNLVSLWILLALVCCCFLLPFRPIVVFLSVLPLLHFSSESLLFLWIPAIDCHFFRCLHLFCLVVLLLSVRLATGDCNFGLLSDVRFFLFTHQRFWFHFQFSLHRPKFSPENWQGEFANWFAWCIRCFCFSFGWLSAASNSFLIFCLLCLFVSVLRSLFWSLPSNLSLLFDVPSLLGWLSALPFFIGWWSIVDYCWLLFANHRILIACHSPTSDCRLSTADRWLLIVNWHLPTVDCWLSIADCWLLVVNSDCWWCFLFLTASAIAATGCVFLFGCPSNL